MLMYVVGGISGVVYHSMTTGVLVGPHTVRRGQWTIHTGIYPVVDSVWLKRNLSGKVLQPGHAARRIRHRQHQTRRPVNRGMSQYTVR